MHTITTVLFDMDGTLVDSRQMVLGSFAYALEKIGVTDKTEAEILSILAQGYERQEAYSILAPGFDYNGVLNYHMEYQLSSNHNVTLCPYAKDIVTILKQKKYAIGLVTNATYADALHSLGKHISFDTFDVIISSDSVNKYKPNPEGINKAIQALSKKADETIYVGDSQVDIQAAKNAKVTPIGVTTGFDPKLMLVENPPYVIDSLEELLQILRINLN